MVAGMYLGRERSERYVQGKRSLCRDDCRQCNVDSVKARLPRESGERSRRGKFSLVGAHSWVLSVQYAGRWLDKSFQFVRCRSTC